VTVSTLKIEAILFSDMGLYGVKSQNEIFFTATVVGTKTLTWETFLQMM
jgi:hypothetical protein